MLLLKTGDPFVAQQYTRYLKSKRQGLEEQKQRNFYQRMQQDIKKRKDDNEESVQLSTNSFFEERKVRVLIARLSNRLIQEV